MQVKQISEHVWSLKIWMVFPLHVWLVKDESGIALVDAGLSSMTKGILKTIKELKSGSFQRILLTHGHSDHVGAIPSILKMNEVPVYAHFTEIPYIEGELAYPGRKKAAVTVPGQITQALPETEDGHLQSFGGLTPYLTPGHSPGHVVYYHEKDRVLLAGDLFTSKNGKLKRPMPMFTADMNEAIKSSEIIRKLNPQHLEVCHGEPVYHPLEQLEVYQKANQPVKVKKNR